MIFRRRVAGDGGAKYRLEVRIHCDICLAHGVFRNLDAARQAGWVTGRDPITQITVADSCPGCTAQRIREAAGRIPGAGR